MEATPAGDFIPDTFQEARHHHETAFGILSLQLRRLRSVIAAIAGVPSALLFPFQTWPLANNTSAPSTKQPTQFSRLQLRHTALATGRFTFISATWKFSRPPRGVITSLTAAITNSSPPPQAAATNQLLAAGGKAPKMFADTNDVAVATTNHAQQTPSLGMVPPLLELGVGTISCGAATSGSSTTKNTISYLLAIFKGIRK